MTSSEKEVLEIKDFYKSILDNIINGVWVTNADDMIYYTNKGMEIIAGIPAKQIVGSYVLKDFPESTLKYFRPYYLKVKDTLKSVFYEAIPVTTPSGKESYQSGWLIPRIKENKYDGIICTVDDVTERKKTERKLKESEEKWRSITKYTPDHILMMDKNAKILSINYTVPDLSIDEVIGRPIFDFVPKEYQELHRNVYDELLNNGEPYRFETGYVDKDGKQFYFEIHSGPVWKEGKVVGIINRSTDITERKITEQKLIESEERLKKLNDELEQRISERTEELRASEEKFRGFLDFGNIGMAITSIDKKWIYCNDQICEIFGLKREELFEKTWADLSYPEDLQPDIEQFNNILDGKIDSYQIDKRFIKKNREIVYTHLTVSCIRNSDGTVKHFLATLQNITEHKKIEQGLKESEEKYRTLFESSRDGIIFSNMEGKIMDCNQAYLDMLGYTLAEIQDFSYQELTPEKWHEMEADIFNNKFLPRGYSDEFEKEYIRKDGIIIPISINVWLIKDDQGNNKGMWAIVRDITERKKAELNLKESEEKYNNLFQYSNDAILLHDFEGSILEVNDRAIELFKYPKEEILALTTPMLRTIEEQERREALREEFSKKGFIKFEFNFIKKDGTIFPGEVSSRAIEIKGKKVIQAEIRDISERKMVEQKLREVNKLKSEFLRRASHELKTPLISIKGFSDLILSLYTDQLDPVITSKLREINDGCERLQSIINNLLKTSRLESPELKPKLQKEDLSFLIKFCVHELESLTERRNQSIKLDINNDLYANIEKEEIHDVISNLLTNAIKYTPPTGKIEVKTEIKENFVVISLKDNGIGFSGEQKKKIFKQFGKIERYGQGLDLGIDGTGLGLYISKRIVESHGGKIWMESEGKNKGSTFYFTLPITK